MIDFKNKLQNEIFSYFENEIWELTEDNIRLNTFSIFYDSDLFNDLSDKMKLETIGGYNEICHYNLASYNIFDVEEWIFYDDETEEKLDNEMVLCNTIECYCAIMEYFAEEDRFKEYLNAVYSFYLKATNYYEKGETKRKCIRLYKKYYSNEIVVASDITNEMIKYIESSDYPIFECDSEFFIDMSNL